MGCVVMVPRFHRGNGAEFVVSALVCGADEVLVVEYQHVPDYDGVFDGSVFLVEQSAVE